MSIVIEVFGGPQDGLRVSVPRPLDVLRVPVAGPPQCAIESTPDVEPSLSVVDCPVMRNVTNGKWVALWPRGAS